MVLRQPGVAIKREERNDPDPHFSQSDELSANEFSIPRSN